MAPKSIYMRIFTLISEPSSLILYVDLLKIYKIIAHF